MPIDQATKPSPLSAIPRSQPAARRQLSRPSREGPAAGAKLSDPIMWAPLKTENLIKSPKEAINVFDFEPVCRANVPPAHFGYMASGIDDEVTLRANREGFLKFVLRPRRLVDVSKVDMSIELLGVRYDTPIIVAPVGGQQSFHPEGEIAVAKAARAGNHLQILSTSTNIGVEEVAAARGAPLWYQLYATNKWDVAKAMVERAEKAGCLAVAVTVDRSGGRNQETLFRLMPTDSRDCNACHERGSLATNLKRRAMYQGLDISGLNAHAVVHHDLGFPQAAARHDEDEDRPQGHAGARGRRARRRRRHGRDHRLEPWRAQRGLRPLHHRRAARDRRGGRAAACRSWSTPASAAAPISSRRWRWARSAVCIGRPYIWGLGAFGQPGVERVLELLRIELYAAMQQVGAPTVQAPRARDGAPRLSMIRKGIRFESCHQ